MIAHDLIVAPSVVVGGGIAGLATALSLDGCALVADEPIGGGSSSFAQGGVAAALCGDDSPALHAADTRNVAAGLADPAVVETVAAAAADRIAWLRSQGVAFDLTPCGEPALGREAGHSRRRIVHAGGDRTGAEIMRVLRRAAMQRPDIQVLERFELVDLITSGSRAGGVLLEAADGTRLAVLAPHVVLAMGGIGACFDRSTNPPASRGVGLAAAARRGVRLADLEFVQFHPTALALDADPVPLLTEALRGAGAVLRDERGVRFMLDAHPDAELAPRDIVARSVAAIRAQGRQALLDATAVPDLAARFPGACALARAAGLDPLSEALPVAPAAHFHMGGIATDVWGATSLAGLWACGEAAATGLHGGNRLASNSLLEGLVFGARVASAIRRADLEMPQGPLEVPRRRVPCSADPDRIRLIRKLIGASLGPVRSGEDMARALERLERRAPESRAEDDLATVARWLLRAALARRESRGAHHRLDFPQPAAIVPARSFFEPEPAPVAELSGARSRVA